MALLISFVGFLLRFLMLRSEKSLWGDEWYSIELAQKSLSEIFVSVTEDVHPPFFYAALHLLVNALGFHEWVFRLIPFGAGVGTVFLVYLLATKLTGNVKGGLFASLLVAISPYWLQLSNEIRSYSLLGFLSCLGTLLFLRLLEARTTWKGKALYGLTALSVVYLEHYGWFWLFGIIAYTVYLYGARRVKGWSLIGLQAVVVSLSLPTLGLLVYQATNTEPVFQVSRLVPYYSLPAMVKKLTGVFWHSASGPQFSMISPDRLWHYVLRSPTFWLSFFVTLIFLGLAIRSLIGLFQGRRDIFFLITLLIFLPVVCLLTLYPIRLHSRYLAFATPYLFILVGNALAKGARRRGSVILLLILTASYLHTDYAFIKMKTDPVHREDYPAMIQYTFEKAEPEDVVCGFLLGPQVPYYERRLGLKSPARYFESCEELSREPWVKRFNKIWLMGYMDMDERTNRRNLARFEEWFKRAGFGRAQLIKRFGGEDGLNSIYVFEKNSQK